MLHQLSSVYRTKKKISTYKKYIRNLSQNDFDLFADHTYAEIVIIPTMDTDLFGHQYDVIVQPAKHSPEQPFCCENVNFGHHFPSNCKSLTYSSDKVEQSNQVVMQSDKAI